MFHFHLLLWAFLSPKAAGDTGLHASNDLHRFVTRPDLMPPIWNVTYHDRSKVAPGYWFVAPYRFSDNHLDDVKWVPCQVGPTIYDNDGELVWSGACQFSNRIVFDFGVTELEGETVLKGNMKHAPFPKKDSGAGFFLNSSYGLQHSILLAKDHDGLNQHEFNIEAAGERTMITTHGRKELPAKDLGFEDKGIWVRTDGFRELKTKTGEVVFDWKTAEHVSLNESSLDVPGVKPSSFSKSHDWDAFHANSVTKNADGNYLVSIRHLDVLVLVSGQDGHIVWRLGGKKNDFVMEDDLAFSRQHHARYMEYTSDRSVISLMDNAKGGDDQPPTHEFSRGIVIELDHKQGSPLRARLLRAYNRPHGGYGWRRGSVQFLPNGNVFLAWTDAGYLSEHTAEDEVVMEARWLNEERFGTYRGYKFDNWVGRPDSPPDVKAIGYEGDAANAVFIYVSWNGATEHRSWRFHSKGGGVLGETDRTGFETVFVTNATGRVWAEALDAEGRSLGKSEPVEIEVMGKMNPSHAAHQKGDYSEEAWEDVSSHPFVAAIVLALQVVGFVAVAKLLLDFFRSWKRKRRRPKYEQIPMVVDSQ